MKIRYFVLFALLVSVFGFLAGCAEKEAEPDNTGVDTLEFRNAAGMFMKNLKSVLVAEMSKGGPASAVSVCADTAQKLTEAAGEKTGLYIHRVSLKYRNPENEPDEWEREILMKFEDMNEKDSLSAGYEVVANAPFNGKEAVRYIKPIKTAGLCLTCHGSEEKISPEVKRILDKNYPDDNARGYNTGDVRGAVSIVKVL